MRVLMVNLGYAPDEVGGAEVVVRTLARELVAHGCGVAVAVLSNRGVDWEYNDQGVRVRFLDVHPMGNQLLNPRRKLPQKIMWRLIGGYGGWSRRKITDLVKRERPDVIHTHNLLGISLSAWTVARTFGIPVVHTLHGYEMLCPYGTMFRGGSPCGRQCTRCRLVMTRERLASGMPGTIVSNSAFTLAAHQRAGYFAGVRSYVVTNAPPRPTRPGAASPEPAAVTMDAAPIRVGYLGRLLPFKGPELLIEALACLPREGWVAKIAGSGSPDYERELKGKATGLPVEFLGWTSRDDFLAQIDLLVVPSLYAEPQGLGVLEAVSRGVPVVHSDAGGLGELAAYVPGTVLFRSGSPHDLTRVLHDLIRSPARLWELRSRTSEESPLSSIDHFVEQYLTIYQEALRLAGRPRMEEAGGAEVVPVHQCRLEEFAPGKGIPRRGAP